MKHASLLKVLQHLNYLSDQNLDTALDLALGLTPDLPNPKRQLYSQI